MIGAGAIASGAQGCIFSPKLEQQGNLAVSGANLTSASKVFTDQAVFDAEQLMLGRIAGLSNEGLLTILGGDFTAPRGLGPANRQSARAYNPDPDSACGKAARPNSVHVLQMPRVDGDIQRIKVNTMPLKFLLKAYNALMRLRNAQVVHGDMGRRNIFFKGDSALIGDFGTSMFLSIQDPDTNGLNAYINRFISPNAPTLTAIKRLKFGLSLLDSISIEAFYALCIYAMWPNKQEYILGIAEGPLKKLIDAGTFDFYPLIHSLLSQDRGILISKLRGRWTDGLLSIANKAAGTTTQAEFWPTVKKVLLNSDIKQFIIASIKYLRINEDDKEKLLSEIVYNSNFTYFYRFGKFAIPDDIIRMLPHDTLTLEELRRIPRDQWTPHDLMRIPRAELSPDEKLRLPRHLLSVEELQRLIPRDQFTPQNLLRLPRESLSEEEFLRLPHNRLTKYELMSLPSERLTAQNLLRIPRNALSEEDLLRLPRNQLTTNDLMFLPRDQLTPEELLRLPREDLTNNNLMRIPHNQLTPHELLRIPPEHRTLQNRVRILKHTGGKKRRVTRRRKN